MKPARLMPVGLGLRAMRGGSVVVAIDAAVPRVVLNMFLATAAGDDRLACEPYHVGAELKSVPEAVAAVAEGRKRQDQAAVTGLEEIVRRLKDSGYKPVAAALLVNRAGWITDLLAYSLSAPEHPAIAEGLAVRDALRVAMGRRGLEFVEVDEKSLPETASEALRKSAVEIDNCLKTLGTTAGKPWRKEQKLACLAAWVAIQRGQ